MEMIGSGGSAFRAVVENRPAWPQIRDELKVVVDLFGDRLRAVVQMGDREVGRENRHGIAEDQVFPSIEDSFLGFGEMVQAEKAGTFVSVPIAHGGRAAPHPPGVVLEVDKKPRALDFPLTALPEQFAAFAKIIPGLFLLREKVETEPRERLPCFLTMINSKNPLVQQWNRLPLLPALAFTLCPVFYALCDSLPRKNFVGSNLILEGIISVGLFEGEA